MKIGITGSTGHLGTAIVPLLIEKGFHVKALLHSKQADYNAEAVEIINGNVLDVSSLTQFVTGCDVMIHCAARISIDSNNDPAVYDTNVKGTINIFNASKQAGVKRFIHVSSIHAFNQFPQLEVLNESRSYCTDKAPRYDNSKRDAQKYVLQNASDAMHVIVLNPTSIAGPPDYKPSLFGKAIMDLYHHKVPSLIDGGFDFCDVRDVAAGIVSAIENGGNGNAYLLSGKWHHMSEVLQILNRIKNEKRSLPVLPGWMGYAALPFIKLIAGIKNEAPLFTTESLEALLQGNKNISHKKATDELNYHCRPFEETVSDLINWFKANNFLK